MTLVALQSCIERGGRNADTTVIVGILVQGRKVREWQIFVEIRRHISMIPMFGRSIGASFV